MNDELKVIVPEDFGRKMTLGVFAVRDLVNFIIIFVGFVALALFIPNIWAQFGVVLTGVAMAWLFAFHKVDNLDYFAYLSLKYANSRKSAVLPSIEIFEDEMTLFNGRAFFRIVQVSNGVPFDFMSDEDRVEHLRAFESMLNACDFPIQFIVKTKKIKADVFDSLIKEESHLAEEYKKLIHRFAEGVHLQFYYVIVPAFTWELKGGDVQAMYRKASEVLDIRTGVVLEYLNVLGVGGEIVKGTSKIYELIKSAV